jgi:multicomponent Na+:H+ antiporter subunit E
VTTDRPGSTVNTIALFVLLMGLWLLASGHYTPLLIGFGVVSTVLVVVLASRMGLVDREGVPVHLLSRALRYIPWITWQVILANIDVARRILHPKLPISPRLFEVPTSQRTDLGRVLYANSITLTPGTVSIRVDGHRIVVHAIADEVAESLAEGDMDRQVTRLEGSR